MPADVYCCEPSWEPYLTAELACAFPEGEIRQVAAGWVECRRPAEPSSPGEKIPAIALARQCLPAADMVSAPSINAWADAVTPLIIERLAGYDGPWRCDVFANEYFPVSDVSAKRCVRIAAAIQERLERKQKRLLATRQADYPPGLMELAFADWPCYVQVALVSTDAGFVSCVRADQLKFWRRTVTLWRGGVVGFLTPEHLAPSRAGNKLVEALLILGRRIQAEQTCVDLGSSPGGWAYFALRSGARVVAVDRSPLGVDIMQHRSLTFVRGDAFRYQPTEPVDWLLCDVVALPERNIDLLQRWLTEGWCRNFCVTIKFQGHADYGVLEPLKLWLAEHTAEFCLRRLTHNKNEVTAMGVARPSGG